MAALIESDLWGLQLTPKKTYSQTVEMPFRITMAALGPSIQSNARSSVMVSVEGTSFVLCSLTPEKCEQQLLNHVFVPGEEITLYTDGDNTISLTGNFLVYHDDELAEGGSFPVDSDYSDYSDDEEDEEIDSDDIDFIDDDEEEEDSDDELDGEPKIIEIKNAKDIKALANGSQKGKSAKVADCEKEEDDEESEDDDDEEIDSDEDDEEFDSDEDDEDEEDDDDDDEEDSEEEDDDDEEDSEEEDDEDSEEDEMETSLKGQSGNKRSLIAAASTGAKKPAAATATDVKTQPKSQPSNVPAAKNQPTEAKKENVQPAVNRQQEIQAAKNVFTEKKPTQAAEEKVEKKVVSLGAGLTYEDVQLGKGPVVTKGQKVNILYKGTLSNGKVFDENFSSKQALPFVVGRKEVVEGLDRAIQGAHVGGVRKITIPPQLAYGNKKLDGIPPNSTLTFEVKVLSVAGKQQPTSK